MRGDGDELVGGVEVFRDISEIETLRKELSGRRAFGDIIGVSRSTLWRRMKQYGLI